MAKRARSGSKGRPKAKGARRPPAKRRATKRRSAKRGPAKPSRLRRALASLGRGLGWAIALAVALPALQAALLQIVDPPVTATMLSRAWQHRAETGALALPEREWVALSELPAHVPQAYIGSEDARFFTHRGFDRQAIEAAWQSYQGGEGLVGGSTISQQVAKNVFLWQGRSWLRKGLEAWYTVWLELFVSKPRILEVYLNVAESGPMTFGVQAGAQRWFGVDAAELGPLQAATLAAMLPNPRGWTPETARVRRKAERLTREPAPMPEGPPWR